MIISYPILPAPVAGESEDAFFDRACEYIKPGEGMYPMSFDNSWHGGVHIAAAGTPIRAIADGEVVAFRFAKTEETYDSMGVFDTSFVLLKHSTETGENTKVEFYSLYMHLCNSDTLPATYKGQLSSFLKTATPGPNVQKPTGVKVYRRDILGFTGQFYNHATAHFEIFATDAQLDAFWKDSRSLTANGSADFYGDAHFIIPKGKSFVAAHPKAKDDILELAGDKEYPMPDQTAGSNANSRLMVSVNFDKGKRTTTSYREEENGSYTLVGIYEQVDYEYHMHLLAKKLYPDCPSAGFEWLRFGRILGPDTTTHADNWQAIPFDTNKVGYIDLASADILKLSDADFPFWFGWQKLTDVEVAATGGQINGAQLASLIKTADSDNNGKLDEKEAKAFFTNPDTQRVVRHLVVKSPSEWDSSGNAERFARLRQAGQPLEAAEDYQRFEDHVKKMQFWTEAGLPSGPVWHFHPYQFVCHMRKCGWLTLDEYAQLLPKYSGVPIPSRAAMSWTTAKARYNPYWIELNRSTRKYLIFPATRLAHYLGQVYIETGQLITIKEDSRGEGNTGATEFYRAFYGRGLMQTTWPSNYELYGLYRAFPSHVGPYTDSRIGVGTVHYWADPRETDKNKNVIINESLKKKWSPRFDPELIATSIYNSCDSAGFYWVTKSFLGKLNLNRLCNNKPTTESIGQNSLLVNGGGFGYLERQQFTRFIWDVLSDEPPTLGTEDVQLRKSTVIVKAPRYHFVEAGEIKTITINYAKQRPL